jgi:signal transduction histidine kinase
MLLQGRADALTPAQRTLLEAADRSSTRVVELLAQMSELARLESGATPLAPQETDLAGLLEPLETIGALPPVRPRADAARLKQALAALARLPADGGAAVAADVRGGMLWLSVGAREEVARTGVPGPDAVVAFDHLRGGHGLSLVLARAVIEAHGGDLAAVAGTPPGREIAVVQLPLAGPTP